MNTQKKLFVYPKDLQLITGKKYTACYNLYTTMKDAYGKNPQQALTTKEVAEYLGVSVEDIEKYLP